MYEENFDIYALVNEAIHVYKEVVRSVETQEIVFSFYLTVDR